jgi:hypothetical protein
MVQTISMEKAISFRRGLGEVIHLMATLYALRCTHSQGWNLRMQGLLRSGLYIPIK